METSSREALSHDIRLLGDMLGETILRLAGKDAFDLEEEIRSATKSLRNDPAVGKARELIARLDALDPHTLRVLIRAFSVYFDLINLAEQHARVRSLRRKALTPETQSIAGSLREAIHKLRREGISAEAIRTFLDGAQVCPVFTAHPTEARRRTTLEKLLRISRCLDRLERVQLTPKERQLELSAIGEEIEALWLSDSVREARPTVLDEVRHGLRMVEVALLEVAPKIYRELEDSLGAEYPETPWTVPPFLRFGSWIGGDRDGNPNVTPTVTVETVRLQMLTILDFYRQRLEDLAHRLSYVETLIHPTPQLLDSLAEDEPEFRDAGARFPREPFRRKCLAMAGRVRRTIEYAKTVQPAWLQRDGSVPRSIYFGRRRLLEDLRMLRTNLDASGAQAAARGAVGDLLRLVEVLGVHMLTLDIRQHAHRHRRAMNEALQWAGLCPDYAAASPVEKAAMLVELLESPRPVFPAHLPFSDETNETIETFRTIASIRDEMCPDVIDRYIISMVEEPSDILEVLVFAKEARLFSPGRSNDADANPRESVSEDAAGRVFSRLDVVPLFETLDALRRGPEILEFLIDLPIYRRHLALRSDRQEVMLGYSDSNKESGFLQSVWALYRIEETLSELSSKKGIRIQMFHGRGGSIGRGGGPANRAILAQPRGVKGGRIRFTEQGEVIADRYGHSGIAERHLEQVLNAVIGAGFSPSADRPDPEWERIVDGMARHACRYYRELVFETPEFLDYFHAATPIREISELRLGSRPVRRTQGGGPKVKTEVDDLRAIPWVFSWMQSRHALPGWYGLGAAVERLQSENPQAMDHLREMYRRWPFWTTTIDNVQMILAKADMTIARLYADLVDDAGIADRFFGTIEAEYRRTVHSVLEITEQSALLDNTPVLQRSIQQRNPYVDPLSFVQLVLIRRLRRADDANALLARGVLESIAGIAAGLKNTG